jgi:hypothetical protein
VQNQQQKNYILPGEIRDAILKYLDSKPHGEVKIGVRLLESLQVLEDEEKEEEK